MAENNKTYWRGIEELTNEPEFVKNAEKEFPDFLPISEGSGNDLENQGTQRRDFLKLMGFSLAAVSLAACEAPVRKAIPYLNKPEDIDPSVANWYASSFVDGGDYCSILVKTREGRPIKIEGNKLSSVTHGGTSARVQASVLSLYDTTRFKGPLAGGKPSTWEVVDKEIKAKLAEVGSGAIRIVSQSIISPVTKQVIAEFKGKYSGTQHVMYDAVSGYGMLKANKMAFGIEAIPSYRFDKASVVVSFGADFLGTWVSPTEYSAQFAKMRKLGKTKKEMSRLYAFEATMSLTGANADFRTPLRVSEEGLVIADLYNKIASGLGQATLSIPASRNVKYVNEAAAELLANKGKSLVVSGSNDANVQLLVNGINYLLGNYCNTVDLATPSYQKQGNDEAMSAFIDEVKAGSVAAVIFYGANPVYDHPRGAELKAALAQVKLKISFADRPDETCMSEYDENDSSKNKSLVDYICPDSHFLESWSDAEAKKGFYSLVQPTISPIFKTRQAQESLLTWAGNGKDMYSYLQDSWKKNIYPQQTGYGSFQEFWNYSLHDGIFEVGRNVRKDAAPMEAPMATTPYTFAANLADVATGVAQTYKANATGLDLVIYEKIGMGSGALANNPWIQEFPDPITRACWENYIVISQAMASKHGIKVVEGKTVKAKVTVGGKSIEGAVIVQPGQAGETVAVSIGYGRKVTGKAARGIGMDAYPMVTLNNGTLMYSAGNATFTPSEEVLYVAQVQTHNTVMGRESVIQEGTLAEYKKDPTATRYMPMISTAEGKKPASELSLWNKHERPNHAWGMLIDLNTCTGCGACVVGCQAENNVPVVGKQEVLNRREMHWIRIDRYYSSDAPAGDFAALEIAAENPQVVFQPVMCQHCNNAPCETVCPVAATTHSTEGLNQMAYNRCIGTRYCANNCPFKVRRFNWFSYPQNAEKFPTNPANNDLGRMVLNPDVTVRARGVMEKCSMCVQRIQEGKLNAKKEGRRPVDGEIQVACAQACPSDAIIFGDMNDENSRIAKIMAEEEKERAYQMLAEINVKPSVSYLAKIRNNNA